MNVAFASCCFEMVYMVPGNLLCTWVPFLHLDKYLAVNVRKGVHLCALFGQKAQQLPVLLP